jgi:hypothetical protein
MAWIDISTGERLNRQQYRQRRRQAIKAGGWLVARNTEMAQYHFTLSDAFRAKVAVLATAKGLSVEDHLYMHVLEASVDEALRLGGHAA